MKKSSKLCSIQRVKKPFDTLCQAGKNGFRSRFLLPKAVLRYAEAEKPANFAAKIKEKHSFCAFLPASFLFKSMPQNGLDPLLTV